MKLLINFLNYFYTNFIMEDWSDWTKTGKIFIYPFWLIRSIVYWCISPLFIIWFLLEDTKFVKLIKEIIKDIENFDEEKLKQTIK